MLETNRCDLLSAAVRNAVGAPDLDVALRELVRPFRNEYDLWRASMVVFLPHDRARIIAAWSVGGDMLGIGTEVGMKLTPTVERLAAELRSGRALILDVESTDLGLLNDIYRGEGVRSLIVLPLRDRETFVGVLTLASSRAQAFDARDEALFTGIAAGIGPRMRYLIGKSQRALA